MSNSNNNNSIKFNKKICVLRKKNSKTKRGKNPQLYKRRLSKKNRKNNSKKTRYGGMKTSAEDKDENKDADLKKLLDTGLKSGVHSIFIQNDVTAVTANEKLRALSEKMNNLSIDQLSSYLINRFINGDGTNACTVVIFGIETILHILQVIIIDPENNAEFIIPLIRDKITFFKHDEELYNELNNIIIMLVETGLHVFKSINKRYNIHYNPELTDTIKTELLHNIAIKTMNPDHLKAKDYEVIERMFKIKDTRRESLAAAAAAAEVNAEEEVKKSANDALKSWIENNPEEVEKEFGANVDVDTELELKPEPDSELEPDSEYESENRKNAREARKEWNEIRKSFIEGWKELRNETSDNEERKNNEMLILDEKKYLKDSRNDILKKYKKYIKT